MNVRTLGQKCLVIVGATGMVGGYALRYALEKPTVGRVTAIGRKKVGISHPKLKEVLHRDFADCSALAETLSGVYRGGLGRGTPHNNRGLHDRVRASSPRQQPRRGLLILERERRGPDGTKSGALRTLQGRGREGVTRGGVPTRIHLPARVHLPRGAAERTEFQLPPVARDLSHVSGAVPQPGDSSRRLGPRHGGCRHPPDRGTWRSGFRKP
jgi:hypothetical protein